MRTAVPAEYGLRLMNCYVFGRCSKVDPPRSSSRDGHKVKPRHSLKELSTWEMLTAPRG